MNSGVYQIMNKLNYRMYIGSTVNFSARFSDHKKFLRKGNHRNKKLQNAWNKYGENLFEFSVVEYVDVNNLIEREQFYTDLWNPEYCIQKECVKSRLGVKSSEETCKKISLATVGENNPMYGRKHSAETKLKLSKQKQGKNHPLFGTKVSDETKKKISEAAKAQWKERIH